MGKAILAQRALDDLVNWERGNEADLYPYFKDLLCGSLSYPKNKVKINATHFRASVRKAITLGDKLHSRWRLTSPSSQMGQLRHS